MLGIIAEHRIKSFRNDILFICVFWVGGVVETTPQPLQCKDFGCVPTCLTKEMMFLRKGRGQTNQ
jgi:hypothetical protein